MHVLPISAFSDNYIWAIIDEKENFFDCVDPGEAQPVLDFAQANQLNLRNILLTHHHHDHIGGVQQLQAIYPKALIYGPADSRISSITHPLQNNQRIKTGSFDFHILFNPGHTATHISYYESTKGWLFCGDTLFSAGCGRVFDGSIEELHQSLLMFKHLPGHTKIFCAHEYTQKNLHFALSVEPNNQHISNYLNHLIQHNPSCSLPSNLNLELSVNPFLRTDNKNVIEYAKQHGATSDASLDVFKVLRHQKNIF